MLDAKNVRLHALASYKILDTAPEPDFDDIVKLAQRACGTPVALLSFVADDRQWFKAKIGFDACETTIGQSVCAHALEAGDLLIVPDLTTDARTKDNTLVTGAPHIRFYAGAVLRTPEGIGIGSLCVIDGVARPHGLTEIEADTLKTLARHVMVIMSFRRAMVARDSALAQERRSGLALLDRFESSQAANFDLKWAAGRQTDAQEAGGVGTFEIDIESDRCTVSAEFCRIFGLVLKPEYSADEIQSLVVEADRNAVTTRRSRAAGSAPLVSEFRIRRAHDGAVRWIGRRAEFRAGADGRPRTMLGIVTDITDRKLIELRANALIEVGDLLRDASTTFEVVSIAARALGETLMVSRAGYAIVDLAADRMKLEGDWTARGIPGLAGTYPIEGFRAVVDRLKQGTPSLVANVPATGWLAASHDALEAMLVRAMINVPLLREGQLVGVLFVHSVAPRTWSPRESDFALAVADRTYAAIAKLEAEAHQRVLNDELSHRLKNTLAMVQAIVTQSLRGITDRAVVAGLEERIIALSKAHDVLLQQSWSSAPIASVIEQVLGLHAGASRFKQAGPNTKLGPKATLSLSLLLHELATNAVKYGALSVPTGHVEIDWHIDSSSADPMFKLSWREVGGPPAASPKRKGFGSRLIGMGLVGTGNTKMDYGQAGVAATFEAPVRSISEL